MTAQFLCHDQVEFFGKHAIATFDLLAAYLQLETSPEKSGIP